MAFDPYLNAMTVLNSGAPNNLAVVNPYTTPMQPSAKLNLSDAFRTQGTKVIGSTSTAINRTCRLAQKTSIAGATAVYQAWFWADTLLRWVKLGSTFSLVGEDSIDFQNFGDNVIYFQLVSITSGTVDLHYATDGFQADGGPRV